MRRMRFAVDAGLKAMKDHLAASGHLPDTPTPAVPPPRGGGGSSSTGTSGWTCSRAGASLRGRLAGNAQAAVKELESRFLPELARLRDWLVQHPCSGERKQ
ncbi:MAG: nucleotidyltransferase [Bilophila wadsworthia]